MNKFRMTMNLSIFALTCLGAQSLIAMDTTPSNPKELWPWQDAMGEELVAASKKGDKSTVEELITAGVNPNYAPYGAPALRNAAENGHTECVRILLAAKANINHTAIYAGTALTQAARNGHRDCVQLLLENGANVNHAHRPSSRTALMAAAEKGHKECVQLLLAANANVNLRERFLAGEESQSAIFFAAREGHQDCVQLLIAAQADVNLFDTALWSPLITAASRGHYGCVRQLIAGGANVNYPNNGGCALFWAASNGHQDCVQLLIQAGTKAYNTDYLGRTALARPAEPIIPDFPMCDLLVEWMLGFPDEKVYIFLMCLKHTFDAGTYYNLRQAFKPTLKKLIKEINTSKILLEIDKINNLDKIAEKKVKEHLLQKYFNRAINPRNT